MLLGLLEYVLPSCKIECATCLCALERYFSLGSEGKLSNLLSLFLCGNMKGMVFSNLYSDSPIFNHNGKYSMASPIKRGFKKTMFIPSSTWCTY